MAHLWDTIGLVLAGAVGFLGGQVRIVLDRRRAKKDAEDSAVADFRLESLSTTRWLLRNAGNGDATQVELEPVNVSIRRIDGAPVPDGFEVSLLIRSQSSIELETADVHLAMLLAEEAPVLIVSWVSHTGAARGPIRLSFKQA